MQTLVETPPMMPHIRREPKTLVITSCCKRKSQDPGRAMDVYQGQLFKQVKSLCEDHGYNWRILSAKYGLITPDAWIYPYDQKMNLARAMELRADIAPELEDLWEFYPKILVIMGHLYRTVIPPRLLLDPKVTVVNGQIGEMLHQVKLLREGDA